MRDGQFSRTALEVATTCVALGADPTWGPRLPEGLAERSEALIVAAGLYSARTLSIVKHPAMLRVYRLSERRSKAAVFSSLARRKIFIQAQVLAAIAAGCRQVVIVGAGLDTLCLRLGPLEPELRFIEVDHPATSAVKARGLEVLGAPDNFTRITADLGRRALREVLGACPAWDPSVPAVFVTEGLLMYLDDDAIDGLFAELSAVAAVGSRVVLTQARDIGALGWLAQQSLKWMGEPWLSSCDYAGLPALASRIGWPLLERVEPEPMDLEVLAVVERREG